MLGRTVFVILLGFFIAVTEAPNDGRKKRGKMMQRTSKENVEEDLMYALAVYKGIQRKKQDNPTINIAREIKLEEQDNSTINMAREIKLEEQDNSTINMAREIKLEEQDNSIINMARDVKYEEQNNLTINFAGEIIPAMIRNPGMLSTYIVREFFLEERNILSKVEFLYQIRGKSPISHRNLEIPRTQEEVFALVYITFLSFFELVNFRVGFLHYSIVHLPNAEHVKSMCDVNFIRLTIAFKEFKNSLKYFIQSVPGFNSIDEILQNVAKKVVTLSTDLVMDVYDLNNQNENPDEYISELINWKEIPLHWNFRRSIFPSVSMVKERVIAAVGQGSELDSVTVFKYIARMMNVFNRNKLASIQQWFTKKIIGINSKELLTLYFKPAVLGKYLEGDEFYITDNGDISVQDVIKIAFELIYKLRNMDFAILHERLPE